jgi:hypothetical protein
MMDSLAVALFGVYDIVMFQGLSDRRTVEVELLLLALSTADRIKSKSLADKLRSGVTGV